MRTISDQTFHLARLLANLQNEQTYAHALIKDPTVAPRSRDMLRMIAKRSTASLNDFKALVGAEAMGTMRAEMLDDEVTLQHEHISDMILALPKGMRDQVERYVQGIYDTYAINKR